MWQASGQTILHHRPPPTSQTQCYHRLFGPQGTAPFRPITNTTLPFFTLPGEGWYLALLSGCISCDPSQPLLVHLSARQAFPYWQCKHSLSLDTLQDIAWPSLGQALDDEPPMYCMWTSKFASGYSAVGKTVARWGK